LVSVMLANNETGVVQPLAAVVELAHRHGALVHTDAVQAPGRIALDMGALGVDLMTVSSHKCGGPQGAAALIARSDPTALLVGGGGGGGRAGRESVGARAGWGAAAELAVTELAEAPSIARRRDALEARVRAVSTRAVVIGAGKTRLPNTSCIALPGAKAETQV